jgi:hypothetical protein
MGLFLADVQRMVISVLECLGSASFETADMCANKCTTTMIDFLLEPGLM